LGERVTIVKLGGSIISDKSVDFSFREEEVIGLGRAIASSGERVVVVHGGGAFGHPMAKKYGLSSSKAKESAEGVAETRAAMFDLDLRVCDSLSIGGVRPYTFSPFPLLSLAGARGRTWANRLLDSGLTPVTFGDVIYDRGFRILSGDTIALELSRSLGAALCVFVMDVDGILGRDGKPMRELNPRTLSKMKVGAAADATGGIALKVKEALRMAESGTEVTFVSGFRDKEFAKALKRLSFHGTIVRVPSRDKKDSGREGKGS
jgi:isopentenyl phosphate kinase